MVSIKGEDLAGLFSMVSETMAAHADELCAMDALMGDGDLGLTMKKGFGALPEFLESLEDADLGKRLVKAGMRMASVAPSTMGTLIGSGLMGGGKALVGSDEINATNYLRYLQGFAAGIAGRGKCARGDRTVLDAIGAAADHLEAALQAKPHMTLAQAAETALEGAKEGVEATRSMEPKYGKAAVHRAVAAGRPDQGASAGMYMLEGHRDYLIR